MNRTQCFSNEIHLRGIVTDISKIHLEIDDLVVWQILMYTEHHYIVDGYDERSHFAVLVFPSVENYQHKCEKGISKGSWIDVEGRIRGAVGPHGEPRLEVVAAELAIVPETTPADVTAMPRNNGC